MTPEMQKIRDEFADKYESDFHKIKYPQGLTVADYCNSEIPAYCFSDGFDACYKLMQEREKVLLDAGMIIYAHCLFETAQRNEPVHMDVYQFGEALSKIKGEG